MTLKNVRNKNMHRMRHNNLAFKILNAQLPTDCM